MGQMISNDETEAPQVVSRAQLKQHFAAAAIKQFQHVELYSFKQNLSEFQDIDASDLLSLLGLPQDIEAKDILFGIVATMGSFPSIDKELDAVSPPMLLQAVCMLNPERLSKVFGSEGESVFYKLIFSALSDDPSETDEKVEEKEDKYNVPVTWSQTPFLKDLDVLLSRKVSLEKLKIIITFILSVSQISIQGNNHKGVSSFADNLKANCDTFSRQSLNILRSFNCSASSENLSSLYVDYDRFYSIVKTTAPFLFQPVNYILETLLYTETEPSELTKNPGSKLVTEPLLAQMASFLSPQMCYSNMQKLYTGSEAGFSMRSFQQKVFKWNAPTILLICGKRVNSDSDSKRFTHFRESFPFLKQNGKKNQAEKVIFGVYIHNPWTITNKDCFGDQNTKMFQLQPKQIIFPNKSKSQVYFNTIGGGIGIGSSQPYLKQNVKKYNPGDVSLTMDAALEYAVFRHLSSGDGAFETGSVFETAPEYEDALTITQLECWGCGDEKQLLEQQKQWDWENKESEARKRINLKNLDEDRAFLEMAGLVGGHGASGGSI